MRELFVYYQVDPAQAGPLKTAVQAMQQALRAAHPNLQARLLQRPGPVTPGPSDPAGVAPRLTWMETYACPVGPGLDASLQAAIEEAAKALAPWLAGPRHTEVFVPCA
jgi:hypothetical protein